MILRSAATSCERPLLAVRASQEAWRRLPAVFRRNTIAALAGISVSYAVTGGLLLFAPRPQAALLIGAVVGLLATSGVTAAAVAASTFVIALFTGPLQAIDGFARPSMGVVLACALLAGGTAFLVDRYRHRPRVSAVAMWMCVLLIVGNVWATTISIDSRDMFGTPSLIKQLDGEVPLDMRGTDQSFFLKLIQRLRAGEPYYQTMHEVFVAHYMNETTTPLQYRLPTLYLLLAAMPSAWSIVCLYLLLLSAVVLSVPVLLDRIVPEPLRVVGAAALASYLMLYGLSLGVLNVEPWAVSIGLLSVSAWAMFTRSSRAVWAVAAGALALASFLTRELMLFMLLAGVLASLLCKVRRRTSLLTWGMPVVLFAGAYLKHIRAVAPFLATGVPEPDYTAGGLRNLAAALRCGPGMFGMREWLVAAFCLAGIVGIAAVADVRLRYFLASWSGMMAMFFMYFGNQAFSTSAQTVNYWGIVLQPVLLVMSPAAFGWLVSPGYGRRSVAPPATSLRVQATGERESA